MLRLREQRGYSQVDLARALGLSASYLNQIERNKRPLTPAVQKKLGEVLGDVSSLFDEDEPAALQEALGLMVEIDSAWNAIPADQRHVKAMTP